MSFANFVATLTACPITGVICQLDEPPLSINTADLPLSYPRFPVGETTPLTMCQSGDFWTSFTADLVVIVEPVAQSRQIENYQDSLAMIDNVNDALCNCTGASKTKLNWTLSMQIVEIAEVLYWAIVATVTGAG